MGFRFDRVIRRACSPKPLDCFEIFCLKIATNKSAALPPRSSSRVHFQGPFGFYRAVATQNSGGLINVEQIMVMNVARTDVASVCFFNHASFSTKMTVGCFGKLILRRERAAGL